MEVVRKSENGIKSGSSGADAVAVGVRNGESDSGWRNATHSLSAVELPVVELGLLRASCRQNDGVPGAHPSRITDRQPQMVPSATQRRREVSLGSD